MKRTTGAVLLALAVGIGAGCKDRAADVALGEAAAAKARSEIEARNVELVRTVIAQLEKGEVGVITRLFSPDFKLYFPSNSATPVSREDTMGMARLLVTAVPDLAFSVLDVFPAGDRVVVRLAVHGTHRAGVERKPSALTRIAAGAIIIFRVEEGLIVEEIFDGDALGLFRQLGLELQPKAPAK